MKSKIIREQLNYTGAELKPLYNYLNHDLLGDSVVAFVGGCNVSRLSMIDGEDLKANSIICGDQMAHFLIEVFDCPLIGGVLLQRLLASLVQDDIRSNSTHSSPADLRREGDDLYLDDRKLSISVATCSLRSSLVHFAVNVTTEGTPVPTLSLQDLGIEPMSFLERIVNRLVREWQSIRDATCKVKFSQA